MRIFKRFNDFRKHNVHEDVGKRGSELNTHRCAFYLNEGFVFVLDEVIVEKEVKILKDDVREVVMSVFVGVVEYVVIVVEEFCEELQGEIDVD